MPNIDGIQIQPLQINQSRKGVQYRDLNQFVEVAPFDALVQFRPNRGDYYFVKSKNIITLLAYRYSPHHTMHTGLEDLDRGNLPKNQYNAKKIWNGAKEIYSELPDWQGEPNGWSHILMKSDVFDRYFSPIIPDSPLVAWAESRSLSRRVITCLGLLIEAPLRPLITSIAWVFLKTFGCFKTSNKVDYYAFCLLKNMFHPLRALSHLTLEPLFRWLIR